MEDRTRAYLRGRFRDYYRRAEVPAPPAADRREWGYIPWSPGGTTMVRHQSLLELGSLGAFLERERPRHVYFSAGRYDEPDAGSMGEKGWRGSDLVFDLDADHLPGVDPDADSYREMLAACKDELRALLDHLTGDFGIAPEELTVVFSGGRGYHVHVRDGDLRGLSREARREVVDYVRGIGVEFEDVLATEAVAGRGLANPTDKRSFDTRGGWGRRAHEHTVAFVDDLLAVDEDAAIDRLREFEGIGEGRANAVLSAARTNYEEIAAGNVDVHPAFLGLARRLFEETVERESAAIDEPVTTDIHRLIRLPGSLHGGTALRVTPVAYDDLGEFRPLRDAVPEAFVGHEIRVRGDGGPAVELRGKEIKVPEGVTTMPEYAAAFLMARGRAEKERE
ncbi:MAG: DNA primase small subunit PriS [Halobacteriales archaeon]